jgi:hypothetical protein
LASALRTHAFQQAAVLLAERRVALIAVAALGLLLTLALHWPGALNNDSSDQLQQALTGQYTDWHPPLMAALWKLIGGTPQAMLALQAGTYWTGFLLLSLSLPSGVRGWRFAIVMVGFSPIGIHQMGELQKDSLLAGLMVLSFGILAATQKKSLAVVPALLAGLCRMNGMLAVAPLILPRSRRLIADAAGIVFLSAILILGGKVINQQVLRATPTGVERSLQWFDLAGISARSGDASVLPRGTELAPGCYTSLFWDSLKAPKCGGPLSNLSASLTSSWLTAIARHPIAYAEHRLAHFNSTTFFLVPAMHQCVEAPSHHSCDFSARGYIKDAIEKNFFFWPVLWLVLGLLLLREKLGDLERTILISALAYGFGYLIVGVAAQFRYFLWTELGVQIAMMLHMARGGTIRWRVAALVLSAFVASGYVARYA